MTSAVVAELGAVAHGGHCVTRVDGRVVFVRHGLPGEHVTLRFTDMRADARYWRADVEEVLVPSPNRVASPWPQAGPGGIGGGELGHVALPAQRQWKQDVIADQLRRLAKSDRPVEVLAAPGDADRGGLAWRTRIELVVDEQGRAGMTKWRSHDVIALEELPLATAAIAELDLLGRQWPAGTRISVAAPAAGDRPIVLVDGEPWDLRRGRPDLRPSARRVVHEEVGEFSYRVAAAGFWQAHREAPQVLVEAVLGLLGDIDGLTVADLYSGAGLFTIPLAAGVGANGRVIAVEGDRQAARDARRNAHGAPQVQLVEADIRSGLSGIGGNEIGQVNAVVLDPPRAGAGREVMAEIAALKPERIVYVACDPAALARDIGFAAQHGYRLDAATGYDLFPMTHHVETVALLSL